MSGGLQKMDFGDKVLTLFGILLIVIGLIKHSNIYNSRRSDNSNWFWCIYLGFLLLGLAFFGPCPQMD